MRIAVLGVDLGKNVCSLVGLDASGAVVLRRRAKRETVIALAAKPKLLGISKRGNRYLRKLLIHGARAALPYVAERDMPLGRWAKSLLTRAHPNVVVVAFANKLARIAWAVLRRGQRFAAKGTPLAA